MINFLYYTNGRKDIKMRVVPIIIGESGMVMKFLIKEMKKY